MKRGLESEWAALSCCLRATRRFHVWFFVYIRETRTQACRAPQERDVRDESFSRRVLHDDTTRVDEERASSEVRESLEACALPAPSSPGTRLLVLLQRGTSAMSLSCAVFFLMTRREWTRSELASTEVHEFLEPRALPAPSSPGTCLLVLLGGGTSATRLSRLVFFMMTRHEWTRSEVALRFVCLSNLVLCLLLLLQGLVSFLLADVGMRPS